MSFSSTNIIRIRLLLAGKIRVMSSNKIFFHVLRRGRHGGSGSLRALVGLFLEYQFERGQIHPAGFERVRVYFSYNFFGRKSEILSGFMRLFAVSVHTCNGELTFWAHSRPVRMYVHTYNTIQVYVLEKRAYIYTGTLLPCVVSTPRPKG